ncbi:hypothetical protein [Gilvimarinus sp. 1_MG-2023]|uniref:hypothetical protein n=1 Tax=Gilvimarinus sp. 1_MG-2023 TaxID=3062638 RepID=UPI0026E217A8|nr:hypothetical protein [Gilvimarinus sp. 1_MG-2023]MDO6746061.1 hypothetical protein [Gilvimarinus sp. 1_MG-2023]
MTSDREKTKTELLQELESIQGLLDDHDIPMLSEVIDKLEPQGQTTLSEQSDRRLNKDEYADLQEAYQVIKQEVAKQTATDELAQLAATLDTGSDEENLELDLGARTTADNQQKNINEPTAVDGNTEANIKSGDHKSTHYSEPPLPLPGQQALFNPATDQTAADNLTQDEPTGESEHHAESTVAFNESDLISTGGNLESEQEINNEADTEIKEKTHSVKASGENPFLPQHIRERLQGNRSAEFQAMANATQPRTYNRSQLVNELIETVLPEVESTLRLKIAAMSEEQIRKLLDDT